MLPFAIDALAKEDRILQKILSTYLPCTPAFRLSQEMMAVVNKIGAKCSGGDRPRLRRERSAERGSGKANRAERSTVLQVQAIAYLKEALRTWKRVESPEAVFVAPCKNGRKAFHFKLFISRIIFIHPTRKSNLPLAKNRRKRIEQYILNILHLLFIKFSTSIDSGNGFASAFILDNSSFVTATKIFQCG
jgi:hypothetical protein